MKNVILIGDSIRMGYQPYLAEELAGQADVWGPQKNSSDSACVLENVEDWVVARDADIVHVNCGLHDIKRLTAAGPCQVPLDRYRENLQAIFSRIRDAGSATLIWATITPLNEEHHQANKPFCRYSRDAREYHAASLEICEQYGLLIDDLRGAACEAGADAILTDDGVHFTDEGYHLLGVTAAQFIRDQL